MAYIEIEFRDGSTARWTLEIDDDDPCIDALLNTIEAVVGPPDTIIL